MTTNNTSSIITAAITAKINTAWGTDLSPETTAALLALKDGDKIPDLIDEDGADLEYYGFLWGDAADKTWDDEGGERIYQLADGVFAHIGETERSVYAASDIVDFLSGWDHDSYGTYNDLLTAFGVDVDLDEADEDYDGECIIWVSYNYYSTHTNAPRDGWVREDDYNQDVVTFASYAEAKGWIEKTEHESRGYKSETNPRGSYCLRHGEYASPDYTICKA